MSGNFKGRRRVCSLLGYLKEEEDRLGDEEMIRFEDWQKSLKEKGLKSTVVIKVGEPVPQVLHVTEDEKADMIVVGRKKSTVNHPFADSRTIEVLSRSSVPVLVSKYLVLKQKGSLRFC